MPVRNRTVEASVYIGGSPIMDHPLAEPFRQTMQTKIFTAAGFTTSVCLTVAYEGLEILAQDLHAAVVRDAQTFYSLLRVPAQHRSQNDCWRIKINWNDFRTYPVSETRHPMLTLSFRATAHHDRHIILIEPQKQVRDLEANELTGIFSIGIPSQPYANAFKKPRPQSQQTRPETELELAECG